MNRRLNQSMDFRRLRQAVLGGGTVLTIALLAQPCFAQCMSGGGAGGGGAAAACGGGTDAGGGTEGATTTTDTDTSDTLTDVASAVAMMNIAQQMYRQQAQQRQADLAQIEAYLGQRTKEIEAKAKREASHVAESRDAWRERQRERQEKQLERRLARLQKMRDQQVVGESDDVENDDSQGVVVVLLSNN